MQWNTDANGGFTSATPWLMVNPNYRAINAEAAERDPDSVLHFYRKLLALRASSETLLYGAFRLIEREHPQIFAYERTLESEIYTIICNMSGEMVRLTKPNAGECVIRNLGSALQEAVLEPYEACVFRSGTRK